jgi:hypothetical protein
METAVAKIQLFGSTVQIRLAQEMLDSFAATRGADLNKLLSDLRNELRKELDLGEVSGKLMHLRVILRHNKTVE